MFDQTKYLKPLFGVSALLAVLYFSGTWLTGDEARYFVPAKAIADGKGYVFAHLPSLPAETITPPVQPFLISLSIRLFDAPVFPAKVVSAVLYVLTSIPALLLVLRLSRGEKLVAAGSLVAGLYTVGLLSVTSSLMAEIPYILFSLTSLYLFMKGRESKSISWIMAAGLLASLAYLSRTVGLALIAGSILCLLLNRSWRLLAGYGGAVAVLAVPWAIRSFMVSGSPDVYLAYVADAVGSEGIASYPVIRILLDAQAKFFPYLFSALPSLLLPHVLDGRALLDNLGLSTLVRPLGLVVGGLVLTGFLLRMRRPGVVEWYLIAYWIMICAYPLPGIFPYYLFPVLLPAGVYLHEAIVWISGGLPGAGRWVRAAGWGVAGYGLAMAFAVGAVHAVKEWPRHGHEPWAMERYETYGSSYFEAWGRFVEGARWVAGHLPADTLMASRKPDHLYAITGLQGWRYDMPGEAGFAGFWEAVDGMASNRPVVLIEDAFGLDTSYGRSRRDVLSPLIAEHGERLELVHVTKPPETRVWRVIP